MPVSSLSFEPCCKPSDTVSKTHLLEFHPSHLRYTVFESVYHAITRNFIPSHKYPFLYLLMTF